MSEIGEYEPRLIADDSRFAEFLSAEKGAKMTAVFDMSAGFPKPEEMSYREMMNRLIKKGVARVPIIGLNSHDGIKSYMLVTNEDYQEHATLAEMLHQQGLVDNEDQFAYTTSIERTGTPYVLETDNGEKVFLGGGSDKFRIGFTQEGRSAIADILGGSIENNLE